MEELDSNQIYFFLCLHDNKYHNLFPSKIIGDLVRAFKEMDEEGGKAQASIVMKVGQNTFVSIVDRPLYLVEYDKEEIFDYAGDDGELELIPTTDDPVELNGFSSNIIDFPSFFTKDIELYLDYKIGNNLYKNISGIWVPLDI